jgi:hypothetical protein
VVHDVSTELDADNTERLFASNRQWCDDGIAGPSKALVAALAVALPHA